MDNKFSFRNSTIQKWLSSVFIISLLFSLLLPPSSWLCGVGGAFLLIGALSNSARTNQWMSWQNEGYVNWFEGWAVTTGTMLIIVPIIVTIIRDLIAP